MSNKKPLWGIFALDGTPILIRVYDTALNRHVDAYKFVSKQVAKETLALVDQHLIIERCGGVIIRELVEA